MEWIPFVRGFCIALFLFAMGLSIDEWKWWVAMLSLNAAFVLTQYA
jgi:hypothetical protein